MDKRTWGNWAATAFQFIAAGALVLWPSHTWIAWFFLVSGLAIALVSSGIFVRSRYPDTIAGTKKAWFLFPCGIAVGVMILWAFGLYRTTEVSEESNLDENLETIHALQNANERLTAEINSMNERGLQSSTLSLRNRVSQLAAEISTFFVSQVASHPAINSSRPDYEEQLRRQDEDQRKMISLFSDQYMERLISIRSELEENGFRDAEFDKLVQDVLDAPPFADSKIKPIADRLSAVAKKLPNN